MHDDRNRPYHRRVMSKPPPSSPFSMSGPPASGRASRTFKPRRGRLTRSEQDAVDTLLPAYLVEPSTSPFASADLVLDIGVGNGETTIALASEYPEWLIVAIDVHTPGLGALARSVHEATLTNVRVVDADALDVLTWMTRPDQIAIVNVSFPDPWPKAGQQHRRLVDASFVALLASRIRTGGIFCFATDWTPYAQRVVEVFDAESAFEQAATWAGRPLTKFQRRGVAAGREITDLAYRRRVPD